MRHFSFGRNLTSLSDVLPLQRRRVSYLDTNAVSDLSRWQERVPQVLGIERARRELCSFASKRTIAVGQCLFSEMAGFEDGRRRDKFEADMRFVNALQHLRVLRAPGEMMRHEVEVFLTRGELKPFIDLQRPISFNDPEMRATWAAERQFVKDGKNVLVQEEADSKIRIDAAYPNLMDRKRRLTDDWQADRHRILSHWVRDRMRLDQTSLGLPRDTTCWPEPERIPTLWCHWAYRITRDILIEILPEPPERKASDFLDLGHYQSGAHVDEFVTRDADLLLFAKEAPGPKPEFLTLEEWVARLESEE